ncbi:MAG: hypothetical protein ABIK68_19525 [bacterium]
MISFQVSVEALYRQKIAFRDQKIKGASIFPFFDQNGEVQRLMVILPSSDDIYLVPWNRRLFKTGCWGSRQLRLNPAELGSYGQFSSSAYSGLYHYDPWWTISGGRFWRHWAQEPLKKTNCINLFNKRIAGVSFKPDLSGLSRVMIEYGLSYMSYRSGKLAEMVLRPALSVPGASAGTRWLVDRRSAAWQLDPVWKEWGGDPAA